MSPLPFFFENSAEWGGEGASSVNFPDYYPLFLVTNMSLAYVKTNKLLFFFYHCPFFSKRFLEFKMIFFIYYLQIVAAQLYQLMHHKKKRRSRVLTVLTANLWEFHCLLHRPMLPPLEVQSTE